MKKKNLKKLLLAVCCAALLVCVSIGATVAYLTSKATVTNTFTVGKVAITLDEAKTNVEGEPLDKDGKVVTDIANAKRDNGNQYKLMPGHEYTKDPTVHVEANSENSWIFVKVENGIADIEDQNNTIKSQIEVKGWKQLTDADGKAVVGVYYKEYTQNDKVENLVVFESFKIDGTNVDSEKLKTYEGETIVVTAYAIQKDGFTAPEAAWTAVSGAYNG